APLVDAAHPPMPRRQSCDRCHQQKVRCVTEAADGASGREGTTEANNSNTAEHMSAETPCVRCKNAGAVCIYSLGTGLANQGHLPLRESYHEAAPQTVPLLSPVATPTTCESWSQHELGLDGPLTPESWFLSPFSQSASQAMTDMAHLTSFSDAATATSIPCVPLFEGPIPDRASETENALGIYSWLYSNPVDYTFQEIAQITQRIHAAALRITSPATTSVPLSSPAVSDILDAANTLVYLVHAYASKQPTLPSQAPLDSSRTIPRPEPAEGPPVSPPTHNTNPPDHCISSCVPSSPATAIDDALDASIRLTIHAAHQALLGVFDALSASCLLYLTAGPQQQQQHQHQQTNPHAAPPQTGCPSVPPSLSQIAATTNLLRSLLDQLDRVVLALGNAGPAQAQQQ
ncbi:uncharacterized protein THITE_2030560, partial [Thermothielavioides terrestris NRRL 8126]